jgi:hypothetical protein
MNMTEILLKLMNNLSEEPRLLVFALVALVLLVIAWKL